MWLRCAGPRVRTYAWQCPLEAPATAEAYLTTLHDMDAVVTARLHTAVVAFSLGIPFVLVDFDQRTHGFVRTYGLGELTRTSVVG